MPLETTKKTSETLNFTNIASNVPAFIVKLWVLIEDNRNSNLVSWGQTGLSFLIKDQSQFSKEILPHYFKHNNFSSFVRQLNMYGFRKVIDPQQGSMNVDSFEWEFYHPFFQRDKPCLLEHVKRKPGEEKKGKNEDFTRLFENIDEMKNNYTEAYLQIQQLQQQNDQLWLNLSELSKRHERQQHVINKLIQFFISVIYKNNDVIGNNRKRLMLDGIDEIYSSSTLKTNEKSQTCEGAIVSLPQTKKSADLKIQPSDLSSIQPLPVVDFSLNDSDKPSVNQKFADLLYETDLNEANYLSELPHKCIKDFVLTPNNISDFRNIKRLMPSNYFNNIFRDGVHADVVSSVDGSTDDPSSLLLALLSSTEDENFVLNNKDTILDKFDHSDNTATNINSPYESINTPVLPTFDLNDSKINNNSKTSTFDSLLSPNPFFNSNVVEDNVKDKKMDDFSPSLILSTNDDNDISSSADLTYFDIDKKI